jgi:hypothetical protein
MKIKKKKHLVHVFDFEKCKLKKHSFIKFTKIKEKKQPTLILITMIKIMISILKMLKYSLFTVDTIEK